MLVEGHTDDVPISTSEFGDNWELASARAINTYKALLATSRASRALKNARGEDLLGVSAYEAHRPVSLEPTPDGRRLNRRIDLRFLIAAPSEAELSAIRERVGALARPGQRPALSGVAGVPRRVRPGAKSAARAARRTSGRGHGWPPWRSDAQQGGRPAGRPPRVPSHQSTLAMPWSHPRTNQRCRHH